MVEKTHAVPSRQEGDWWTQFYDPLRAFGSKIADFFSPTADAAVTDDYYEISMELPGVTEEEIHVEVHDYVLKVTGEKKHEHTETGKTYYFSERAYGAFSRSFRLPEDADREKIFASHKDGILTVKVAKLEPKKQETRKIEVSRG